MTNASSHFDDRLHRCPPPMTRIVAMWVRQARINPAGMRTRLLSSLGRMPDEVDFAEADRVLRRLSTEPTRDRD